MQLHLLAPEEGVLLLLPRRAFAKRKSWRTAVEPHLPVLPSAVALRRSQAPLRRDPLRRVPILLLFRSGHRRRKRGVWLSPLLLQRTRGRPESPLLLTTQTRWLLLAPVPCIGPLSQPPGSPTVRTLPFRTAEKRLLRSAPLLLLRLLGSPRLLPLLIGLYPSPKRRRSGRKGLLAAFATALAIGTSFLPGTDPAAPERLPRPPGDSEAEWSATGTVTEPQLSPLWTLLTHLGEDEVETIHFGNGVVTLRIRATDPFSLARRLLELQPAASAVVEPPLGEAAGSVELTVPVE